MNFWWREQVKYLIILHFWPFMSPFMSPFMKTLHVDPSCRPFMSPFMSPSISTLHVNTSCWPSHYIQYPSCWHFSTLHTGPPMPFSTLRDSTSLTFRAIRNTLRTHSSSYFITIHGYSNNRNRVIFKMIINWIINVIS